MQVQKVLTRMKKLEKEMHKAALDFLKLKDIPDKIEISSVEMAISERKHAQGY